MKSRVKERQKDNSIRREKSRTDTWKKKKKSVGLYFGTDLTCSQHVSPLVNHHLCGRWHSERPGRKLSWSADLLPPQRRGRGVEGRGGVLRCQESSTGLKTVAPAVSITRMKPNCTLLFTAELSIKHLRGASSGMSLFPRWSGVSATASPFLTSVIISAPFVWQDSCRCSS